jgi:predicted O-methyltransferase YrrM
MRQIETYVLCRILKPKIVVETGVEMGVSTAFILKALEDNNLGQLYSIEISRFLPNGEEVGCIVPTNLRHRWNLVIGNSLKVLPTLCRQVYPIDIFIHDSEHTYKTMFAEYSLVWPNIRVGGIILSDDTGRNEAFIHFSRKVGMVPTWTPRGYGIIWKL